LARLGRQSQARLPCQKGQRVVKATCSLEVSAGFVPTPTLAMPSKAHCPQAMGPTCGRREREADAGNEEERSSHVPAVATVKGTLILGMPTAFAGCRGNAGLGRSGSPVRGSFPCKRSHRRQQVSSGRTRRGTSSACARRTHSSWSRLKSVATSRTRPSLSPETRARQSSLSSFPTAQAVAPAAQAAGENRRRKPTAPKG